MEFSEVICKRRSVRKFTDKKIPNEVIEKALDDALLAPNTSNIQPWEFYWVQSSDKKEKMIEACLGQSTARTAGELVVAVANLKSWNRNRKLVVEELKKAKGTYTSTLDYYEKLIPIVYTQGPLSIFGFLKSIMFWCVGWFKPMPRAPNSRSELSESFVKTVALGCENFMLSIADQGYGSCPMEGFDSSRVKKILGLTRHHRVVMVMSVGDPAEDGIWGEQIRLDKKLFIHKV